MRIGDDGSRRQYRSILSFDTSSIPDGATITAATLTLRRTTASGTPTSLGNINVAIRTAFFGAASTLANNDFESASTADGVATLPYPSTNTFTSGSLNGTGLGAISKTAKTQFRVAFATDDDNDGTADTISFATGNNGTSSYRPTLEVTYQP